MRGRMVSVFLGMLAGGFAVGTGTAAFMHWQGGMVFNSVLAGFSLVLCGVEILTGEED